MHFSIRLPKVKIHVWGGLGSQLHAWYLFESLQLRYPNRKFVLVFHTSGVTRRLPEILNYLPENSSVLVDDYQSNLNFSIHRKNKISVRARALRLFKPFISPILINSKFDGNLDSASICFWTLAIRGHYSANRIDDETLQIIASKLGLIKKPLNSHPIPQVMVIHVRLGDLLELTSKFPTDLTLTAAQIAKITEFNDYSSVRLHSDSPEIAETMLSDFLSQRLEIVQNENPLDALLDFVRGDCFVGTSSKLGVWAAIFRSYLNKPHTYLPSNLEQSNRILMGLEKSLTVNYY
jgi:hypothetical protein